MDKGEESQTPGRSQCKYETEVSYEGGDDLPRLKTECEKNPGHLKFIPAQHFTLSCLPSCYQDQDILELIQLIGTLAVCLYVSYTSPQRPSTWPDSDEPYPFQDLKGKKALRTGTGWVELIHDYDEFTGAPCKCQECEQSENPKTRWGKLIIQTAQHILFDDEEGKNTVVALFYDNDEDTPVLLRGNVMDSKTKEDWSLMYCYTHDMEVVYKLLDCQHRVDDLRKKIYEKYSARKPNLVAIASHPHGCSKQITVGEYTKRDQIEVNYTRYTYNAATCNGCSGARVWILGDGTECKWVWHPHSSTLGNGQNQSAIGFY